MHHNFASYSAAEIVPPNKHHTTTFPASCQNRLGGIETRLLELKKRFQHFDTRKGIDTRC